MERPESLSGQSPHPFGGGTYPLAESTGSREPRSREAIAGTPKRASGRAAGSISRNKSDHAVGESWFSRPDSRRLPPGLSHWPGRHGHRVAGGAQRGSFPTQSRGQVSEYGSDRFRR